MSFISDLFGGDQPDYSQAEFHPYGVSSPFGTSTIDEKSRNITATLSPELKALYDKYITAAGATLPTESQIKFGADVSKAGQGLFDQYLGNLSKALSYDVGQSTSDYYNQQQKLLAPGRAAEDVALADTLFKTGRTGAGTGMVTHGGVTGYINPEQFSLLAAREGQNAQLALSAEDRARAIREAQIQEATGGITNALGLFGTGAQIPVAAYGTSQNILSGAMGIPTNLGQQIGYGLQAGSSAAQAGANVANMQQQQYQSNLGFWGGLLGAGTTLYGASQGWFKH